MDLGSITQEAISPRQPKEGQVTKAIEKRTAQLPSTVFLGLAGGAMAASIMLAIFSKNKNSANFVGQWVPTFLILGLYNKIVKTQGSDQSDNSRALH